MMLRIFGNVLLFVSAAEACWFVARYHWKTSGTWRLSHVGQHVMAFVGSMAAVLVLASIRIVVGDSTAFLALRTAVFLSIPIVLAWRIVLLEQVQRDDEFEEDCE